MCKSRTHRIQSLDFVPDGGVLITVLTRDWVEIFL